MKDCINKLIEIGKKESCTDQEFSYFLKNSPDSRRVEFLCFLRQKYKINTSYITEKELSRINPVVHTQTLIDADKILVVFIVNLIKGIHIVMSKAGYGRSSTTTICNLFGTLIQKDKKKFIALYNWISLNGGNHCIQKDSLFKGETINQRKARYKQEEKERKIFENIHTKAEARKQKNRDDHLSKSKNKNKARDLEIEKLNQLDKLQQLKNIVNSSYPLNFYPEEFSNITIATIKKLSSEETQNLIKKLKNIKKGSWKLIAKLPLLANHS